MAKKKKSSKSRSKSTSRARNSKAKGEVKSETTTFWQLSGAVVLLIAALFLLLGGFGAGGPLPVSMFSGTYWALGFASYVVPLALIYWGAYKFKTEDHRIPLAKLISIFLVVIFTSSFFYTLFFKAAELSENVGHGGSIGQLIGSTVLGALNKWPASILFIVLAILAVFFSLSISPKVILKLGNLFKRGKGDEDTDIDDLKAKASESSFKLNEGVPVEHGESGAQSRRLANFKNSVAPPTKAEEHEALTIADDPNYKFPPVNLLNQKQDKANAGDVSGNAEIIKNTYSNFNIDVEMEGANVGPRITQYTLRPPTNVKLTKVTALEDNLRMSLGASSIRIEAPIPGKKAVGVEVPNIKAATVRVSSLLESAQWHQMKSTLGFVLGKDVSGAPVVADLARMPHLLVAGQTGSGKSVMINTILTSLLYRNAPSDLKLVLVDPKRVELTPYHDIPHLLSPVITEPEKCVSALKWAVAEMERRLKALAEIGKRNIAEYNLAKKEEGMPYIVIVIDELADLMMVAGRDAEALIVRVAQKARAVGIHLILATQRPSVDVITGLIKNNVPGRIAFAVPSQVDSRTMIDQAGAEKLLGQGDMLLKTAELLKPVRIQGAFISEEETAKITDFLRAQQGPDYNDEVVSQPVQFNGKGGIVVPSGGPDSANDDMWSDAVQVVVDSGKASVSLLQRRLRIGYGRAARIIETMEEQGIISASDGSNRPREVLVSSVEQALGGSDDLMVESEVD